MFKIGDFSKLSKISIRMLRHYNDLGLLIPERIDEFTGYRYYSASQLVLANRISLLKAMGFSLNSITKIIEEYNDSESLRKYLLVKHEEIKEQAESMERQLLLLETTIQKLGKDFDVMNIDVVLKEIPERYVASVRKVIAHYNQEGLLWEKLIKGIEANSIKTVNPCYPIAVFHDQDYKENDVDVEVQVSVDGMYSDTEEVKFKTIPAIGVASVIVKGSYDQLSEANEAIANWITDNQYEICGAMFNINHVSPGTDPNPENWETEVCYPVRKK
ncbi:MAG: merR [Oscillospiraceae bacterium]|nr:merR [Oscillospiraceae bacterium]